MKKPFQNEADVLTLDNLTVENRVDRVSIFGNIDLTADQSGYQKAIVLHALLSGVLAELESRHANGTLPDHIEIIAPTTKKNPFLPDL